METIASVALILCLTLALSASVYVFGPENIRNGAYSLENIYQRASLRTSKEEPDDDPTKVNVRMYHADLHNFSTFPEYPYVKHRPSVGICFSGGGTRSFQATLGYLKALFDSDLLKNVRYISSVSGGSWANAVFSYHDENVVTLKQLLGDYTPPEKLTIGRLRNINPKSARAFPVRTDLLATLAKHLIIKETVPDDVWVTAVHATFLKPAGISISAIPAWTRALASATLARNQRMLEEIDFKIPCSGQEDCPNVPFPILNAAMLGPIEAAPFGLFKRKYVMMETTPMYVGFPRIQNVSYQSHTDTMLALGGFVEPLGFGSRIENDDFCGLAKCHESQYRRVPKPLRPFGIANATAISSWAPAALVAEEPLLKPLENVLITTPYFSPYWGGPTRDVFVGDGAVMENQGVIALLRRGVKSICMFINTPTPLASRATYHPFKRAAVGGEDLDSSFAALFGVTKFLPSRGEDLSRNQVFRKIDFARVVDALQVAQQRGKGAVVRLPLTTITNRWWGLKGGHHVDMTFVYLGRVYEWERRLQPDVANFVAPNRTIRDPQVLPSEGRFKDFPHLSVSKLHMDPTEANALADLSAWVVYNNIDIFRKALSPIYKD